MQAHDRHALGQRRVARRQGATLSAGGDVLGRVERKRGQIAGGADAPALVIRANRVRGVLDDDNAVAGGNGVDGVHVAGLAEQMHGNDGLGPGRDGGLEGSRVKIDRVGLDIRQHRRGTAMDDDVGGRGKRDRRGDDFVTGTHPHGFEGQVQGGGARVHRHAVPDPDIVRELPFKRLGLGAGRQPAGAHGLEDGCFLFGPKQRLVVRQERVSQRCASVEGQWPRGGRGTRRTHDRAPAFSPETKYCPPSGSHPSAGSMNPNHFHSGSGRNNM